MRVASFASIALLAMGCAKQPPPPAAAAAAIPIDGQSDKLEGDHYLHHQVGTHIAAPPEKVWEVLTDADAYMSWNSTMTAFSGEVAQDGKVELQVKIAGKRKFKLDVSTFEPHTKMVWEDGNNIFRGVRTFTLTEADGGTDFTMREVMTGSMLPMIAPKLPDFGPDFVAWAADLKAEVERRNPPPPPAPEPEPEAPAAEETEAPADTDQAAQPEAAE